MILSASASNRSILRDVRACSSLLVISIEPSDVDVNVNVNVSTVSISYVREVDGWMGLVGGVVVCAVRSGSMASSVLSISSLVVL